MCADQKKGRAIAAGRGLPSPVRRLFDPAQLPEREREIGDFATTREPGMAVP